MSECGACGRETETVPTRTLDGIQQFCIACVRATAKLPFGTRIESTAVTKEAPKGPPAPKWKIGEAFNAHSTVQCCCGHAGHSNPCPKCSTHGGGKRK